MLGDSANSKQCHLVSPMFLIRFKACAFGLVRSVDFKLRNCCHPMVDNSFLTFAE